MKFRITVAVLASVSILLLGGCTEEKAAALYQAAMLFKKQADVALDSYENLIVQASLAPDVTARDEEQNYLITQVNVYNATAAEAKATWRPNIDNLRIARSDDQFKQTLSDAVGKGLRSTRLILDDVSAAFAMLPDVVYFSDPPVKCSEQLVAQLSKQFLDNAALLSSNPVKFITLSERANTRLAAAIRGGVDASRQLALKQVVEVLDKEKRLNHEAIANSIAAADSGLKLLDLVRDYAKVTLKDIISFANKITPLADLVNEKGAGDRLKGRLEATQLKLNSDPRLSRLATRDLKTENISCR
ncbi:MAG: hypothetical protein ACTS6J_09955 [Burkholderiales bacterium]